MLVHHLFYNEWSQQYYNDFTFQGVGIVNQIGIFSKLCVAIFVFASGYGLAVSTPKDIKLNDFYWRRFKKLYLNYWIIWLLFVPISIVAFGRTFTDAYGDNIIGKLFLDIFGLLKMFGYDSYNPTWWFYNCIIVLYLLFPILNKYLLKTTYLIISLSLTIGFFRIIPGFNVIIGYLFPFVAGILLAKMPPKWFNETKWAHLVLALLLLSIWKFTRSYPKPIVDALLCTGMALFIYKIQLNNIVGRIMAELGKHSMNMFLIHTFIFCFWFKDYIYITRNPLLIFLSLLVSSYLFSVIIEWIKQKVGFYKL